MGFAVVLLLYRLLYPQRFLTRGGCTWKWNFGWFLQKFPDDLDKAAELAVSSLQVEFVAKVVPYQRRICNCLWTCNHFLGAIACQFCSLRMNSSQLIRLQAVLKNTIADYDKAPKTHQLELRLIQSVNELRSPEVKFPVETIWWRKVWFLIHSLSNLLPLFPHTTSFPTYYLIMKPCYFASC